MKREVYKGYQEAYMTGEEIINFLSNAYGTFGPHHSRVCATKIKIDSFKRIVPIVTYRVFFNDYFFKIMDGETDKSLYFIGYTKNRPRWAKD